MHIGAFYQIAPPPLLLSTWKHISVGKLCLVVLDEARVLNPLPVLVLVPSIGRVVVILIRTVLVVPFSIFILVPVVLIEPVPVFVLVPALVVIVWSSLEYM